MSRLGSDRVADRKAPGGASASASPSTGTRVRLEAARRTFAVSAKTVVGATILLGVALLLVLGLPADVLAQDAGQIKPYGDFPVIGGRGVIWITAQVHRMFAAFVLGVPMFAVVVEAIGIFGGDRRYDKLAKEFTRLLLIAYSATAASPAAPPLSSDSALRTSADSDSLVPVSTSIRPSFSSSA